MPVLTTVDSLVEIDPAWLSEELPWQGSARSRRSCFANREPGDQPGNEREQPGDVNRPNQAESARDHAGQHGAHGISQVSPGPINTQRPRSPTGRRDIADCGEKR